MIVADSLTATFARRTVVNDISFQIEPANVVGFLGPNGAGKSTTMRLLTGYLHPASGSVQICGFKLHNQRSSAQACIGYLPEAAQGFDQLTVSEFLRFCGQSRGLSTQELGHAMARVCEHIALAPALNTRLDELSKGWRQRAWFAQALLHDPPVLILDEPTDGLDPNQKRQVRSLIRELMPHKTILLSTHILEEAEELCSRVIIMNAGELVADAPIGSLLDQSGRLADGFHRLTDSTQRQSK